MRSFLRRLVVNPFSIYDREAPDVIITFGVGSALVLAMMSLWVVRYHEKKNSVPMDKLDYWTNVRAMISAAIDNDNPVYTIVKISAQSIMFLGGIQIDYHTAFTVMLIFFTIESSLDTFRTLLCVYQYSNPKELVITSADLKKDINTDSPVTQLQPTNVYEDLTRVSYVVVMVFVTQFLLISFVVGGFKLNSSGYYSVGGTLIILDHHCDSSFLPSRRLLTFCTVRPTLAPTAPLVAPSGAPWGPGYFTFSVFSWLR